MEEQFEELIAAAQAVAQTWKSLCAADIHDVKRHSRPLLRHKAAQSKLLAVLMRLPKPHPEGCHVTDPDDVRVGDCSGDGHYACNTCVRKEVLTRTSTLAPVVREGNTVDKRLEAIRNYVDYLTEEVIALGSYAPDRLDRIDKSREDMHQAFDKTTGGR